MQHALKINKRSSPHAPSASSRPALLFDCDGVLCDTERDGHRVTFNAAFKQKGLDCEWDVDLYGELLKIGGGKERMTKYFNGAIGEFQLASSARRLAHLPRALEALFQAHRRRSTFPAASGRADPAAPGGAVPNPPCPDHPDKEPFRSLTDPSAQQAFVQARTEDTSQRRDDVVTPRSCGEVCPPPRPPATQHHPPYLSRAGAPHAQDGALRRDGGQRGAPAAPGGEAPGGGGHQERGEGARKRATARARGGAGRTSQDGRSSWGCLVLAAAGRSTQARRAPTHARAWRAQVAVCSTSNERSVSGIVRTMLGADVAKVSSAGYTSCGCAFARLTAGCAASAAMSYPGGPRCIHPPAARPRLYTQRTTGHARLCGGRRAEEEARAGHLPSCGQGEGHSIATRGGCRMHDGVVISNHVHVSSSTLLTFAAGWSSLTPLFCSHLSCRRNWVWTRRVVS